MRLEIAVLSGPPIIVFVAFVIFPVVLAAYYGFYKWQGYGAATDWVGLNNYRLILTDPAFHQVLCRRRVRYQRYLPPHWQWRYQRNCRHH